MNPVREPSETPRRRIPPMAMMLIMLAVFTAWLVAIGVWDARIPEDQEQPWALTLFIIAGGLAGLPVLLIFTRRYWIRLDEAAKEAQKWAFYWGGSVGMGLGLGLVLTGDAVGLARRLGFHGEEGMLAFGALMVAGFQLVGFLVGWGWWWFRKR